MMGEFRDNQALKIKRGLTVINALNIVIGVEIATGRWSSKLSMFNSNAQLYH
jgi:hypothetical protein